MNKLIAAAVLGALANSAAQAQTLDNLMNGIDVSFGGFGTVGTVRSDSNKAKFVRGLELSGSKKSFAENVDSNLGVQATVRFNSWLSATAQVLADNNELTDPLAWAYVKVEPLENLSIKLGKVEMPLFMVSDSRDIGYANSWMRPPNEVYSLAQIEELKGGEATYSLAIGPTRLVLTGYAGNSVAVTPANARYNAWDVHGGEVRLETEWVTFRGGIATTHTEVTPVLHDKYTFEGVGFSVDHSNIVAQAEFVRRYDSNYKYAVDSTGWYALGGYRFGKVLPYVSYASTTKAKPFFAPIVLSGNQNTKAVGVRWDAFKSADLKFQFERVDPKGTRGASFNAVQPGFGNSEVNVVSLALDFVF